MTDNLDIKMGFAERQTPRSPFSHFEGSHEELMQLCRDNWHRKEPSYRAYDKATGIDSNGVAYGGVVSVPVPCEGFWTPVVTLSEGDDLVATYKRRYHTEEPRLSVGVRGHKSPARSAHVILYHASARNEDGKDICPATDTWYVTSINASPLEGPTPIQPMTLMHNHFGSTGGTSTGLSDSEFVEKLREAFDYWKDKVLTLGAGAK